MNAYRPAPRSVTPRAGNPDPLLSLVVPVFDEEAAIPVFMAAVERAMPAAGFRLEFVFVNDGSRDATLAVLDDLARLDERVVVVDLSRNFGKEAAMTAGLAFATGDVVVPIDVDLQDPPEVVPQLLDKWREGYDVVLAVRSSRASDTRMKRLSASGFYQIFNTMSSLELPANVGDFRLMDRAVVDAMAALAERSRFMKGLFAWTGFSTAAVEYVRAERAVGGTKWNYLKLWNFALDGIFSFTTVPIRIWTYVGLLVAAVAIAYAAVILIKTLMLGVVTPGYASMMEVILIIGAIQIISIGLIGEYVGRIFIETKRRPLFIVRSVSGGAAPAPMPHYEAIVSAAARR